MTTMITEVKTGRSLLPEPLFARLVDRIVADCGVEVGSGLGPEFVREWAVRVMDQALAFLGACAVTDVVMSPTEVVDIGWHTFILHTREYMAFCDLVAGRYIHHLPTDQGDPGAHGSTARAVIDGTVTEIRRAGFVVDDELWEHLGADCSQCHQGCANSPQLT